MTQTNLQDYINARLHGLHNHDALSLLARITTFTNIEPKSLMKLDPLKPCIYVSNNITELNISPAHDVVNGSKDILRVLKALDYMEYQLIIPINPDPLQVARPESEPSVVDYMPKDAALFEQLTNFNKQNLIDAALDKRDFDRVKELTQ